MIFSCDLNKATDYINKDFKQNKNLTFIILLAPFENLNFSFIEKKFHFKAFTNLFIWDTNCNFICEQIFHWLLTNHLALSCKLWFSLIILDINWIFIIFLRFSIMLELKTKENLSLWINTIRFKDLKIV